MRVSRSGTAQGPTQVIVACIDSRRGRFGLISICAVLTEHGISTATSTYDARKAAAVSPAMLREAYCVNALGTSAPAQLGRPRGPQALPRRPPCRLPDRPRSSGAADAHPRTHRGSARAAPYHHHPRGCFGCPSPGSSPPCLALTFYYGSALGGSLPLRLNASRLRLRGLHRVRTLVQDPRPAGGHEYALRGGPPWFSSSR